MMYGAAYNILKDPYEAEDTVHNAFLRLLDHLDKIDPEDKSRTKRFILIITENAAIDIYRKRKHTHLISSEDLIGCTIDSQENTADRKLDLEAAIDHLPIQYRNVLLLKYSHGYSNEEIGNILHISPSNVRQRLSRARNKLGQLLDREGIAK